MKLTEFVAMTDTIRLATNKALDAGNQFSTPWRVIGRLTGVLENALYDLPKSKRDELLKQLVAGLEEIEQSYAKEANEVRKAA